MQDLSVVSRLHVRKNRGKQVGKHRKIRRSQGIGFAALMTIHSGRSVPLT